MDNKYYIINNEFIENILKNYLMKLKVYNRAGYYIYLFYCIYNGYYMIILLDNQNRMAIKCLTVLEFLRNAIRKKSYLKESKREERN